MTEMSAAEAAIVARFDAAEPAPESCVERVARAMAVDLAESQRHPDPERYWEFYADLYRQYAQVALTTLTAAASPC